MAKRDKNISKSAGRGSKESVRSSYGKSAVKRDSAGRFTSAAKPKELTLEQRIALANEVMGKYAHVKTSSVEFMKRKQEEIAAEDRRWQP